MKRNIIALLIVVTIITAGAFTVANFSIDNENVSLSGKVTDFENAPVDSALVRVLDKNFKEVCITYADVNGNFEMQVPKGNYNCVYATKKEDYRKTKLEYWAWNVPLTKNMEIYPKFNNMEVYGVNVFEPQVTPHETYMIYFRPMSLKKIHQIIESQEIDNKSFEKASKVESLLSPMPDSLFDMAPKEITPEELNVQINGFNAKIVNIQRIKEFGRGMFMYGYIIQVIKPNEINTMNVVYDKISITLHSSETNEIGMGEAFIKRNN